MGGGQAGIPMLGSQRDPLWTLQAWPAALGLRWPQPGIGLHPSLRVPTPLSLVLRGASPPACPWLPVAARGCPVTSPPPAGSHPLWGPASSPVASKLPLAKVRLGSGPLPTRPGPVIQEPTLHEPRTTSLLATLRGHAGQAGEHNRGIRAEWMGGLSATRSPPQAQHLARHLLVGSPPPSRPRGPRVQDLCPPCSRCLPGQMTAQSGVPGAQSGPGTEQASRRVRGQMEARPFSSHFWLGDIS